MSNKHFYTATFFLIVAFLGVLSAAFFALYPFKVVEVKQPMPVVHLVSTEGEVVAVEKLEYRAGDRVVFKIDYCKYGGDVIGASKILVNDTIYSYSSTGVSLPLGCNVVYSESTVIPSHAHSGTYRIEITVTYQVNPLQTQTHTFVTQDFYVQNDE